MTVLLTVMGVTAAALSYRSARDEAGEFLDGQLRQVAINAGGGAVEMSAPKADQDEEDKFRIDIWDAATGAVRRAAGGLLPRLDHQGFGIVHYRGVAWRVYLARDAHKIVQVGQRMVVREEMARSSGFQAGAPILVTIPLAWIVIGFALGAVLRPVKNVALAIAARGLDSREPLPLKGVPLEISPLVESMNGLADRLQRALSHQKRFLSDAAHELRTPLAALRIQIDNLAASSCGDHEAIEQIRHGIDRASSLVAQLLRMARAESIAPGPHDKPVDLAALISDCVAGFVALAGAKDISLGLSVRAAGEVAASADDLQLLFGNLLENAIRYTEPGGEIDVSLARSASSLDVEILDNGCGISEEHMPRVFDRFYRAAPPGVEGTGLGLAIAEAIAKRYGFAIRLENRGAARGVRAIVSVPVDRLVGPHSVLRNRC